MMETIKSIAYVEGFLTAMGAVMQDREMTNETPGRITTETQYAVNRLRSVEAFVKGMDRMIDSRNEDAETYEAEIARLRELNEDKQGNIEKLKIQIKDLLDRPTCNVCAKRKDCEYVPGWGERVRINCPLFAEEDDGK